MDNRCKNCFANTYNRLLLKFPLSFQETLEFSEFFNGLIDEKSSVAATGIQRKLHHKLKGFNGISDPFLVEKKESNKIALELYDEWKPKVLDSDNPFNLALRLAIAGNIMDYGANQYFNVQETIKDVINADFAIDHAIQLKQSIMEADNILYLGDNAGEIVFDKLLIETMMHPEVTYVVKGGPILNDATLFDAQKVGMDRVADVISNGYDAPSTILEYSSLEFQSKFDAADLIISKGQGNLEGLMQYKDKRIFFLLMVKCDVIAELFKVKKGNSMVYNQSP